MKEYMQKKYNSFKILKIEIIKKKTEERGGEENSTELQKPNVEAEVYNNNKKCDYTHTHTHAHTYIYTHP